MNDVYRTADPMPMWSVTYSRLLSANGPYKTIECTSIGIEARDEDEAIKKALHDDDVCSCKVTIVDVHRMGVPSNTEEQGEKR